MIKKFLVLSVVALVGICAPVAKADLNCGDLLSITGSGDGPFATTWGAGLGGAPAHPFCSTTTYPDPSFPTFSTVVSSGTLPPPPGTTFAGYIQVDFTNFAPGDFPNLTWDVPAIKTPGGANPINGVSLVSGPGTPSTDGFSINWAGLGPDVLLDPIVRVEWTQGVPEPASLSLVAFGTLALLLGRRK